MVIVCMRIVAAIYLLKDVCVIIWKNLPTESADKRDVLRSRWQLSEIFEDRGRPHRHRSCFHFFLVCLDLVEKVSGALSVILRRENARTILILDERLLLLARRIYRRRLTFGLSTVTHSQP